MKKRLSLRARLGRVIIVTGISLYLLTSLIVAAIEIKGKKNDYASAMITTVKTCEAIIRDYINQYHEYIQRVIAKMPDDTEPVVINYFQENLHFQNLRDIYYILDSNDRIVHIQKSYEQYQGINLSHIEYISEKVPVSMVHQSLFSQQPVVSLLYPLAGNKLLILEKDLKGIIPLAEHFNLGEVLKGGFLFILSSNGTVVYHPDSQLIDSRHNLGFELTDWSAPDARGLQTFTYHDKKYLCYKITLEKTIGWTLYFVVPHTALFRAIIYHVAQIFLIFAAVFSFLIFFLQLIMNKKLSEPVSEIVASISSQRLDGADEPIPQSKASGTRELTSIIDAINTMMAELNRSHENLRESEQRHRTLVETMTDAVFTLDTNGQFSFLNPGFEKITGHSVQDFIGRPFSEILAPEYIESTRDRFRQGLSGETIPMYEVKVLNKDGKRIPIELNVTSLLDAHGNALGRIGVARNITERKQAEEGLKEAYEIINRSPAVAFLWRNAESWPVEFVSDNVEKIFGYTAEEFISGKIMYSEIIHPDDLERVAKEVTTYSEDRKRKRFNHEPYRIVAKDGKVKWIDDKTYIRRDEKGRISHYQGIVEDNTERRQAEEALRESQERLKTILDSLQAGIVLIDPTTHTIIDANLAAIEMIGAPKEQIIGQVCHKYICPTEIGKCPITDLGQKVDNSERTLLTATGAKVPILKTVTPILLSGQTHLLDIFIDVTEKKELEAQLQQAQKMEAIGTLAGGIAHNFNNILMGIEGYVSLMLMDIQPTHPYCEKLEGIEKQIKSGAELTKQLLGFARGGKYEIIATNLNELIKTQNRMFGRTKKEITIREKYEENLWIVNADQGQIEQVILNLYVNAWQAMPSGGDLYVQTENVTLNEDYTSLFNVDPGRYVKISITDTGVGMDEETQRKIFEPFFTTKEMGRGTGLGLASVYGIIKNHNGIINVDSTKGVGTTFSIYLPVSEQEVIRKEELHEEILKGNETVFLVDDEEVIIDVGEAVLKTLGYTTLIARGGEEAIEIYKKNNNTIDIVILDIIMPGIGGGEIYDRMKEINPDVKVLLSSGYSINGQATKIIKKGCDGFIQKPFDIRQLAKRIREILDKE